MTMRELWPSINELFIYGRQLCTVHCSVRKRLNLNLILNVPIGWYCLHDSSKAGVLTEFLALSIAIFEMLVKTIFKGLNSWEGRKWGGGILNKADRKIFTTSCLCIRYTLIYRSVLTGCLWALFNVGGQAICKLQFIGRLLVSACEVTGYLWARQRGLTGYLWAAIYWQATC